MNAGDTQRQNFGEVKANIFLSPWHCVSNMKYELVGTRSIWEMLGFTLGIALSRVDRAEPWRVHLFRNVRLHLFADWERNFQESQPWKDIDYKAGSRKKKCLEQRMLICVEN